MRWLELTVEADVEAVEAVSEIFGRLGRGAAVRPTRLISVPGDELAVREDPRAPYLITAHVPADDDAAQAVESTERALWHLQAFGLRPIGKLQVTQVDDQEWNEAWKRDYTPQRIGRVVVVPSWLDEPIGADEVAIRLDPGMAFGTGLHPTTRGCLQLLQCLDFTPDRVLDVGSGSGILGIAALRLGARHVEALDTDPIAVEATLENAVCNNVGDRLAAHRGTLNAATPVDTRPFPLVLANLVASALMELAAGLAINTDRGGTLIASGIIADRASEVVDALTIAGFDLVERLDDGEWVSLRMTRRR
jgi:ribosomal protein L11 methyltransferase